LVRGLKASESDALVRVGRQLRLYDYQFTAVTPATHRIVLGRAAMTPSLRAIFGWNVPFREGQLEEEIFTALFDAGFLDFSHGQYRSLIRFATIDDLLLVHSAFPTIETNSVFFGPDSYRFVRLLRTQVPNVSEWGARIVDIGCGTGAGGLFLAKLFGPKADIILADINPLALDYSAVNAAINDVSWTRTAVSDVLDGIDGQFDVIISNPPYLVDFGCRTYRHGGGDLGSLLAARVVQDGLQRLRPKGRLVLYTGVPILGGADPFFLSVRPLLQLDAKDFVYEELDPDIFGEELRQSTYDRADRIAAVGLTVTK
jgi:SAM-dependent methyltransferase